MRKPIYTICCTVRQTLTRAYEVEASSRDEAMDIVRGRGGDEDERIVGIIDDEIESEESEWE